MQHWSKYAVCCQTLIVSCALLFLACETPRPPTTDPKTPKTTTRPEPIDLISPTLAPKKPDALPPRPKAQGPRPKKTQQYGALRVPPGSLDRLIARLEKPAGQPLVVVQYGDSHSRAMVMPTTLRDQLGTNPEPGYTQVGHPPRGPVVTRKFGRWKRHNWLYGKDVGPFGPMGVAFSTGDSKARIQLIFKNGPALRGTRATLFYAHQAGHLPFELRAGKTLLAEIPAATGPDEGLKLGAHDFEVPEGTTEVTLSPTCRPCDEGARLSVFGFLVHQPDTDISWDNFGVGGTTIIGPHKRSDHTLDDYLGRRDPDLVVLWYGANSSPEPSLVIDDYKRRYRELVQRVRKASPTSSCLLVGPPDLARFKERTCFMDQTEQRLWRKRNKTREDRKRLNQNRRARACSPQALVKRKAGGGLLYPAPNVRNQRQWKAYLDECSPRTPIKLPEIVRVQEEVAEELGCAYFDIYEDMGGEGTMMDWSCKQKPQLGSSDLIHLTKAGYKKVALSIHAALMQAMP